MMDRALLGLPVLMALLLSVALPAGGAAAQRLCNTVMDGDRDPVVTQGDGRVLHADSHACPAELAVEPAAAPDPGLPLSGTLYFDFDVAELNPRAREALQLMVEDIRERALRNVVVAGYADRAGSDAYNMDLSSRRARTVAQALRAAGVPARVIQTSAFGETDPAVPTADGVGEARNRRAVIGFEF